MWSKLQDRPEKDEPDIHKTERAFQAYENLLEPLKAKLSPEEWEFLLSRGKKFIDQFIK